MRYIETLREGERIQEIYLCRQRTTAMTKTGKEYENVILQDKTGSLDAKIWDPHSMGIDEFDALDYVEVNGDVTVFNGQTQLSIKRARKISETDVDPTNYLPCTNKNIDEMMMELTKFIAGVNNPYYKQVLTKLFIDNTEFAEAFKKHSAAKSVHHGFIGGLLEHTLSVAKMCNFFAKQYPILNRDLLMTSAICHDIGKVYELSDFPMNDYTDAGQLLGHIVMGSEMLGKIMDSIPDFPTKLKNELKHCILAHHGELEYGSPKKPALIEAMALNLADNADAKIETMTELLNSNSSASSDQWLGYNRLLETNVRKTSELK
ncbi:3'-5' exoribonuclease YhaM family protein [uncultured Eubacterium sp.]|uniref:3'-5' exoribonuclease YhaM family protein n=1 Tax=uncultured Eubacterium sp. TaxID=165185 RepID=UPI0025963647|nr:HD domain-containing protein [uncultured Eubacterium sp.]